MRCAQYLTAVPLLLCIVYASALVFANVFAAAAPNDPRDCVSYSANGAARLDMNCESFGGRIPLNVTIPTDHELEFKVGIDRKLAGQHCRYSDPHDRVRARLSIRSGCDDCFFEAIYFHSLGNRNAVWYLDADGLEGLVVPLFKNHTDSVTFNINGSRIVMTLPDGKSHDKYEIDCRIDPCLEQESQKTYQLSFETADTACGFYVKFPTSVVLFPTAYTSTAYQLSQTSTTDSRTTNEKSTSTAFLKTTATAARQFIDGSTVEITQPSVDIELSLPADEPLRFKMSFPLNTPKQFEDCMFGFHMFSLNPDDMQTWTSRLLESKLEISSGRCTLSASFKGVLRQGTFVFEGARLQGEPWVYWHPLVTIGERTATLSDETHTHTTRLPCELAFQKDEATKRQRVVLRLKADFGFCNAKLTFPNTVQLLRPVAVTPTAVAVRQPTTTVLEPANSGSSSEESTSAAAPNATPAATKQFVDGSTVEITEPSVDVELSLPADEPLRFKISCYLSCASFSNDLDQQDRLNEISFTIPRKIEFKSKSCTLRASYRASPHQEFVFEGARLTQKKWVPHPGWQPLVVIDGQYATLSYESGTQSATLPCQLNFKRAPRNRKSVVLTIAAETGFCKLKTKLIFPDTVQVLRPADVPPTASAILPPIEVAPTPRAIFSSTAVAPTASALFSSAALAPTAKTKSPLRDEHGRCYKKCPYPSEYQASVATRPHTDYKSLMALIIPTAFLSAL